MSHQACAPSSYNFETQMSQEFQMSQTPQTSVSVSHPNTQNLPSSYIQHPMSFVQSYTSLDKKLMES